MYISDSGTSSLRRWIRDEVEFSTLTKNGKYGIAVKRVQEWLCLHGISVVIDRDFGPATDAAVKSFQSANALTIDGVVGPQTFDALVKPMRDVIVKQPADGNISSTLANYAALHLTKHPREIGGENSGPWVRFYMKGNEGVPWSWCAGFVSFLLRQSTETHGVQNPIKGSFSCDLLAVQAKNKGLFFAERDATSANLPKGTLFLVRRTSSDWIHTGVLTQADASTFNTIEGNTNDDGVPNGYEVCSRIRAYPDRDFIVF